MIDRHLAEFAQEIRKLCAAFGRSCTEATIGAFWDALKDMPLERTRIACEASIRDLHHFPSPGQIRAHAASQRPSARNAELPIKEILDREASEWANDPIRRRMAADLDRARGAWSVHGDDRRAMAEVADIVRDAATRWGQEVARPHGAPATGLGRALPFGLRTAARGIVAAWRRP